MKIADHFQCLVLILYIFRMTVTPSFGPSLASHTFLSLQRVWLVRLALFPGHSHLVLWSQVPQTSSRLWFLIACSMQKLGSREDLAMRLCCTKAHSTRLHFIPEKEPIASFPGHSS